jgi:NADPH:quinone reductase-like Zn-dependent oxidoreductase
MIRGLYGIRPALPAIVGSEGIGRISAVGAGVDHVKPGDRVLLPYPTAAWQDRANVDAAALFALPADVDPRQLAMLGINPTTAYVMLTDGVALAPGDWVIQNSANSGVGRAVIAIARARGVKTVNVVRREDAVAGVVAAGGDHVLVQGPDLARRVAAATGGAPIKLALDGVGGDALATLSGAVAPGGAVVVYSAMSGTAGAASPIDLIFRGISLRGFWLAPWVKRASRDRVHAVQRELATLIASGALSVPVAQIYPLDRAAEALAHAARFTGKVLFAARAAT